MLKKTTNKLIFYKILLILLILASVIIAFIVIRKYSMQEKVEKENIQLVTQFNEFLGENKENQTEENVVENQTEEINEKKFDMLEFKGYKVIGIIKIPAIDLEYPILEETTQETMKVSISRFWGGEINSYRNVSLAGHNNRVTLTMFGKNKNLKNGDSIFLTDLSGKTVEYQIYDTFITHPNDVTVLQTKDKSVREVTLITCSNGHTNRLINKAREIK